MNYPNLRTLAENRGIVLASASPRRVELLERTGVAFIQCPTSIPEVREFGESPGSYARRLAREKASAYFFTEPDAQAVAVGCDTIVVLDGRILEKPRNPDHAVEMLHSLSGRTHSVITAVALVGRPGAELVDHDTAQVTFYDLDPGKILQYVATGEPSDKAGAYGIQGMGAFLVDSVQGEIDTVVGLPLGLLERLAAYAIEWKG